MHDKPDRKLNAHLWERHPEDWYIEPEWVSERLFAAETFEGPILDPACGLGRIVSSAIKAGHIAEGRDKARRSALCEVEEDFLRAGPVSYPNIVSNPPFGIAEDFVRCALLKARKVAMLLPGKWLYGDKRSRWLEITPLVRVWLLAPRPSMPPGPVIEAGIAPGGGKEDFAWFVWENNCHNCRIDRPQIGWLRRDDPR